MRGIDTNVLVRFLVRDDKLQAEKVYRLFKQVESDGGVLFVPLLVVLELIWVLESAYGVNREEIVASIGDLLLMPVLLFEHRSALRQLLAAAPDTTYDLSDLLIAFSARVQGCKEVLTFDKKASRFELFEIVQ